MRTVARLTILAALAAIAAGASAAAAHADDMDDLAKGEWQGKATWKEGAAGGSEEPPPPGPAPNPSSPTGGTPSPGTGSGGTGETAGDPDTGGTAGGTGPVGPSGGTGDDGPGSDPLDPGTSPSPGPAPGPVTGPTPLPPPQTSLATCQAHWVVEEEPCDPELVDEETLLTLVLFRNDAYGFICNGYVRAMSTWYADWFVTSEASHGGMKEYRVYVRLEQECPNCNPTLDLIGLSSLEAKAKVRALWGGVSAGSSASATAGTVWGGDLDCSTDGSASVQNASHGDETEIGHEGITFRHSSSGGLVYQEATGGTSDTKAYQKSRTEVHVQNKASLHAYADDVDNVSQAKARVGHEIKIDGRSKCGAIGTFDLVLEQK